MVRTTWELWGLEKTLRGLYKDDPHAADSICLLQLKDEAAFMPLFFHASD